MSLVRSTIKDVAVAAGVTAGTVSRALRGDPRVIETTRRRILDAADRLGYRPNLQARALQTGRTGAIGLSCPSGPWILAHPYFAPLHAGLTAAAAEEGVRVILYTPAGNGHLERDASGTGVREMLDGRVDGSIIYQAQELAPETIRQLQEMGLSVVLMNTDEEIPGFSQILSGTEQRARETLRWAHEMGVRRLVVLGLNAGSAYNQVVRIGMESARLPVSVRHVAIEHLDPHDMGALEVALDLALAEEPDGILFSSDFHLARYLHRREKGLAPKDLPLFSFGGAHFSAPVTYPGVHYMETDLLEAGRKAYQLFKDAQAKKPPRSERLFWSRRPD
jgi:DNA-binding LacI/PurR family transcriptional regulator